MRLGVRGKLAFALGVVGLATTGGSLLAVERYLLSETRERLIEDVHRARDAYVATYEERMARRQAEAQVVAEEPRLKAIARTAEIDEATLEDVMDEMRRSASSDLFALLDPEAAVLGDVSEPKLGKDLRKRPGVEDALRDGRAALLWIEGGQPFDVVLQVLRFGTEDVGLLVTGYRLDDRALGQVRRQLGADLVVVAGERVVAAALSRPGPADLAAMLERAPEGVAEVALGGERFVAQLSPHPRAGGAKVRLAVLRSLDAAYAAHAAVRRTLLLIGALALCGALLVAVLLSRNLTRRIEALSAATAALRRGDAAVQVTVTGSDEVAVLGGAFNDMTRELERSRRALVEKEALEREMAIARRIQTALLPASVEVEGYRIAGCMVPAEQVGGDFYDVLCCKDGLLWLAIGDVTSHGVTPGLIMMMAQTALSTMTAHDPGLRPGVVLEVMNRVIYANVHDRLKDDNYMTLSLFRSDGPGRFAFAGAHLDIAVRRAATGAVDFLPTPGAWTGVLPEIYPEMLLEGSLELEVGDVMVLFTDGLTEAQAPDGRLFGNEGVAEVLAGGHASPGDACQALLVAVRAHMAAQDDDITILALERRK